MVEIGNILTPLAFELRLVQRAVVQCNSATFQKLRPSAAKDTADDTEERHRGVEGTEHKPDGERREIRNNGRRRSSVFCPFLCA